MARIMDGLWEFCPDPTVPTGTVVTDYEGNSNLWDDFTTGGPIGVISPLDGDGHRRIYFWGPCPGALTGLGFVKGDIIGVGAEGDLIKAGGALGVYYTGKAIIGRAMNATDLFVQITPTFPNIVGGGQVGILGG